MLTCSTIRDFQSEERFKTSDATDDEWVGNGSNKTYLCEPDGIILVSDVSNQ